MSRANKGSLVFQRDRRNINIQQRLMSDRTIAIDSITPTPFQQQIIDFTIDLALLGGRGGGKSFGKCQGIARRAIAYGGDYHALYLRKTFPGVRDFEGVCRNVFRSIAPNAKYNQSTKIWSFGNGATLELNQLTREKDYDKFQGRSFTEIIVDEAGQYDSPALLDLMISNLRGPIGIPTSRTIIANPGGVGHGWIRERYIDDRENGIPYINRLEIPGTDRFYDRHTVTLLSTYLDNTKIDRDTYLGSLLYATANDKELESAYIDGNWNIARGAFFGSVLSVDRSKIPQWRELPDNWITYLVMDYGSAAPTAVYLMAESPGATVYDKFYPRGSIVLVDELYIANASDSSKGLNWTIPEQAAPIKSICNRWGIHPMGANHVADDACFAQDGRESIAQLFLKEGIRWNPAKKGDRLSGWEQLRTLMRQAGTELPGLYVSESCTNFWKLMPLVPRSSKHAWDVDTDSNDHIADAVRYGCLRESHGIKPSGIYVR